MGDVVECEVTQCHFARLCQIFLQEMSTKWTVSVRDGRTVFEETNDITLYIPELKMR